jgi:hypothetical protein
MTIVGIGTSNMKIHLLTIAYIVGLIAFIIGFVWFVSTFKLLIGVIFLGAVLAVIYKVVYDTVKGMFYDE